MVRRLEGTDKRKWKKRKTITGEITGEKEY
jgi:hypothetical protein